MGLNRLRRLFEPAIRRGMHFYWRFSRAATLGARAMLIDGTGRIFLSQTFLRRRLASTRRRRRDGETLLEALTRELAEEGNIRLGAAPQLYGVYFNKRASRRDHVALFIVRDFRQDGNPKPNYEIIAHGFFPNDALPEDATRATRARVAEVFGGAAVSELW